jgi:hypothetical protein
MDIAKWKIVLIQIYYKDRPQTWLLVLLDLHNVSWLLQCVQHIWFTTNGINQYHCLVSLGLVLTFWQICKKTCHSISILPLCAVYLCSYCTECRLEKAIFIARENNTNWLLNITDILIVFRFTVCLRSATYHSASKLCAAYCPVIAHMPFLCCKDRAFWNEIV